MKLLVVIPALNEEQSIESTILRTHKAKEIICKGSKITSVDIVVVSDGSTDNTVPIVQNHTDKVRLIIFEKNKGYGAAIKAGWDSIPDADLFGFLDADGTCDPDFFAELCSLIISEKADIVLGSRLHRNSKMPLTRRIGNTLFSVMLSLVTGERINDTASGMRVIRKSALHKIMPLPDGLHFTPAMSARAILSKDIVIVEKDMAYLEREGESKLKIWKDGFRFLSVILENIFLYMPYKIFNFFAICCFSVSIILIIPPFTFYIKHSFLEDWMLYRFVLSSVFGVIAIILFFISRLTYKVISFTLQPGIEQHKTLMYYLFESPVAVLFALICYFTGTLLIINSIWDRITTGLTNEHWSRYICMIALYLSGTILLLSFFINKVLHLIRDRLHYLRSAK